MSAPLVVVTQPVADEVRSRLATAATLRVNPGPEPWPAWEVSTHLRGATAMMAFMTDRVDASVLEGAPQLRVVACALKGFDSFDVDACTRAGVWVTIVPDLLTEPTAELAIGLAISLGRHVRAGDEWVRSGRFAGWRPRLYGRGLHGSTVAVVGLGRLGRAIVERLQGFGCARIVGVDPGRGLDGVPVVTLEEAVRTADFVILAAPLTPRTRGLIAADVLLDAKPGQLLVNVGRGSVVDEEAVADALESGRIAGYAADVFEFEDWALRDRPEEVSPRLRSAPNTLFTPHLGSAVTLVRRAIEHRAADNILAVLRGERPPDAINAP